MPENPLQLIPSPERKQLLIAESELNRARLAEEIAAVTGRVHALTDRARALRSTASAVAVIVAAVAAIHRLRTSGTGAKPSVGQALMKGAGLLSSLWLASRTRGGPP